MHKLILRGTGNFTIKIRKFHDDFLLKHCNVSFDSIFRFVHELCGKLLQLGICCLSSVGQANEYVLIAACFYNVSQSSRKHVMM